MAKFSVDQAMQLARARERKGDLDEARNIYQSILEKFPNNARARGKLAALSGIGRESALQARVDELVSLYQKGQFDVAAQQAPELLKASPSSFDLWNILATASYRLGRLETAELGFRKVSELYPDIADAHNSLGATLKDQGRLEEAIASYEQALRIKPDYAQARSNLGNALMKLGRLEEAIASYERALRIKPDLAEARYNIGNALMHQGRLEEAVVNFERALRIRPDYAEAHSNLGNALTNLGRREEAIASFERALRINPDDAEAHCNLANASMHGGRFAEAMAGYERALLIKPDLGFAQSQKMVVRALMCDWTVYEEFEAVKNVLGIEGDVVLPFSMLAFEDSPERQFKRAKHYARQTFGQGAPPLPAWSKQPGDRLRVGYFSADFYDHATLYLMSGLLREHDRSRFEIFCYSYGARFGGAMRKQAEQHVDHFIDIGDMPNAAAVELARKHELDIAVDLKGYTRDSRPRLFAQRMAPVQINYLGFPGTMGADFIDTIIADRVIIPESERHFFAEKIVYLPHSYQPNDNQRQIAETRTRRADFGLPEGGFVFCCFNNSYKLSPREFDIWMRLLGQVEGSVLWLLRSNSWAEANLRREAEQRGIDPDRLVFAETLPHAEHLARHKHADLFIDTFNVNAHTTVSDALWAGLPVVTKAGRPFAARVAASLLTAIGLPELITETEADYEALILDLARNPERLAILKAKLAENRLTQPLYDTIRYTRDFEQALEHIFAEHKQGAAS